MAEARQRDAWNHTSQLLSLIANIAAAGRKKFTPADFHPFVEPKDRKTTMENPLGIYLLKEVFIR